MANTKYTNQRKRVTPLHVSLRSLRLSHEWTLDDVCRRFEEATGRTLTRGALSALETGLRGASSEVAEGLALAFKLKPEDMVADYQPRERAA